MKPVQVHVLLSTLNHFAFNGVRITVTLYAASLQASPAFIGLLTASFGCVSAFTSVPMGRWIDRSGPRAPMMLASLVIVAGAVLAGLFDSLWVLFLVCPFIGMFNSTFQIATQQTVGQYGQPGDRPSNFALQSLGVSLATFVGPMAAGLAIDHLNHSNTFLIMAAVAFVPLAVIGAGVLHFPERRAARPSGGSPGGWGLLRARELRKVYVVATLNNVIWSVVGFMIPIYGVQIGLSATKIGTLMACMSAGVVGVRIFMPMLTRRWRSWPLVLAAHALMGAGFLGMPFTASIPALVGLVVAIGIGLGLSGPLSTALMYDASPPDKIAELVGMRMTGANVAQVVVPTLFGAIGAAVGVGPVFWTVAAIMFADVYSNRSKR